MLVTSIIIAIIVATIVIRITIIVTSILILNHKMFATLLARRPTPRNGQMCDATTALQ